METDQVTVTPTPARLIHPHVGPPGWRQFVMKDKTTPELQENGRYCRPGDPWAKDFLHLQDDALAGDPRAVEIFVMYLKSRLLR
jgi:hypothetical protein